MPIRYDLTLGFHLQDLKDEFSDMEELMTNLEIAVGLIDENILLQYFLDESICVIIIEMMDDVNKFNKIKNLLIKTIGEDIISYKKTELYDSLYRDEFNNAVYKYYDMMEG